MALTAEEEQRLANAGLVDLFKQHRKLWGEMAKKAYEYTSGYLDSSDVRVRVDDVIKVLEPVLRVTPTLTDFLAEKKFRQRYWTTWFGDLILDRLWPKLSGEESK